MVMKLQIFVVVVVDILDLSSAHACHILSIKLDQFYTATHDLIDPVYLYGWFDIQTLHL